MEEINLLWTQRVVDKIIKKHGVTPEEVEEVVYEDEPILLKGPGKEGARRYYISGQTLSGRYVFVVLERESGVNLSVITARNMEENEKRHYRKYRR